MLLIIIIHHFQHAVLYLRIKILVNLRLVCNIIVNQLKNNTYISVYCIHNFK
jgi:hypothetical protein